MAETEVIAQGDTEAVDAADTTAESTLLAAEQSAAETAPEGEQKTTDGEKAPDSGVADYSTLDYSAYPEGLAMDEDTTASFQELGKESGLSAEVMQKIIDFDAKRTAALQDMHAQQRQAWADEVQADKDIGGVKMQETLSFAQKAVDAFGGQELKDFLNTTGLGNHPAMVRAFAAAGRAISEDKLLTGKEATGPRDPAQTLFDKSNMN